MNICILTHTMPRFKSDTNSASFISELAASLSEKNNKVFVLAPFDQKFENYNRGFQVITYKYIWPSFLHTAGYSRVLGGNKKMKLHMYFISTLMSISALIHLIVLVRKHKIDIVCAHWIIPNGVIAALAEKITGVVFTVTIPGSDVYLANKNLAFKIATKFSINQASWVISDNKHYLDQLSQIGVSPEKQTVIRYGVDTNFLKPKIKDKDLVRQLDIKKEEKVILAMGRFVEKKGFEFLIKAMPSILKTNARTKLLLIGSGDLESKLRSLIKKLKIEHNAIMPGSVAYSDRAKYYNLADVFVMPSTKDSQGNIDASPVAMMDAMACGVPVVATKYSGSPDLIINGETGWMVKENSSVEIAKAVNELLNYRKTDNMKSLVRRTAILNFSLSQTSEKYLKIFENILSK